MADPRLLTIVQPYVPAYRQAFFDRVVERLAHLGITCVVAAPDPVGTQGARYDAAQSTSWHLKTQQRSAAIGRIALHSYGAQAIIKESDLVVVPAAATVWDSQFALFGPGRKRRKVALWGHIDSYVKDENKLDVLIEQTMMRRSDHVFAYTSRGRARAIELGVESGRTSALVNTVDLDPLVRELDSITASEEVEFRSRHDLTDSTVFGYIGGLDKEKSIDVVAAVLDELYRARPDVKVLIGGRGTHEDLLSPARDRGQAILLGFVGSRDKAMILRLSAALINPGRIGLLAVECLASGTPVVTMDSAQHAPEFDYLVEGCSVFTAPASPDLFAQFLATFDEPAATRRILPLDDMVERFIDGIEAMGR